MMKFKSLFRRGPSQTSGKGPEPLKGAPSVSSLDSKHHKIAPSKEKSSKLFGSKEKLNKGLKKRGYGWNNNSLAEEESGTGLEEEEYGSAEEVRCGEDMQQECVSLPVNLNAELKLHAAASEGSLIGGSMQELEALRRELDLAMKEKASLESRLEQLAQRAAETDALRAQLDNMKVVEQQRLASLERLADENGALRARLRGVAHSPLSDSEKRQLLLQPTHHHRMHSSAPASIALASTGEGEPGEASSADWDKHSSSSLSEVSVACLQDRILQMEENHYSTSEELQATLAELADLQSALAEAQADNERLADEKQVLLESLCRQTEKLEDSRSKVDTLQEMLLREGEPEPHLAHIAPGDSDQQLLIMLKIAQDDRRLLMSKQEQLNTELADARAAADEKNKECERLNERIRNLESSVERAESERGAWEREAAAAREAASSRQQQLATLTQLLDQAKTKLSSLEEALAERSEGAEAAAAAEAAEARRDAEAAAARAHQLAERLAHAQRQLERAHTDARKLHDDHLVSRNNAKSTISELEFQAEQLRQEKETLQTELAALQDSHSQLQVQCQVLTEEKMAVMSRASEALARAADSERQLQDARTRYAQLARDRERDEAEWKQFQSDLLMTVRVANDFKTEAQKELERLVSDNKTARDKIRALEDQIHNMKALPARAEEPPQPPPLLTSASLQDIMATATSHRRNKGVSRQDSRLSVKSLIESIENAAKVAKQQHAAGVAATATTPTQSTPDWSQSNISVSSSSSSLKNGLDLSPSATTSATLAAPGASYNTASKPPQAARNTRNIMLNSDVSRGGSPPPAGAANMPDEQRQAIASAMQHKAIESFVRRNSYGDICERKDPLNALQVKNGGSKRNALLKWCQQKTVGYKNIDITNFSSSWNDGLALCALLHSYLGAERVPYDALTPADKRTNFSVAFAAAEAVGVPTTLNIQDMIQQERPDWQQVMAYVTSIYKHFET